MRSLRAPHLSIYRASEAVRRVNIVAARITHIGVTQEWKGLLEITKCKSLLLLRECNRQLYSLFQ
jgi:hypothetical protein